MQSIRINARKIPAGTPVIDEPLLDGIYRARGIQSSDELTRTLQTLPSHETLKDSQIAAKLLADAILNQEHVMVVGDFDTDGATSTAVVIRALRSMGCANATYLVPNRFKYGYGLSVKIVDEIIADNKPDLIITVDNGISSHEGVEHAKAQGIKVIVTDHHTPSPTLPKADAVINPKRDDCDFPTENLAGVGVAFFTMIALRAELRDRNWFEEQDMAEPNMAQLLDIVALGTVADMVPLDHVNRTLVFFGLRRIQGRQACPGIYALLSASGRNPYHCQATDLAFSVAPKLNAAGRLEDMSKGIACLLVDSPREADTIAHSLTQLNTERRQIETSMQEQAEASVKSMDIDINSSQALCLLDPEWHQGVIGLVASRIKNRYHRPVVVFTETDAGILKGSARSIPGLHIHDALQSVATKRPDILSNFGGHTMAAGLSLEKEHYDTFKAVFTEIVDEMLQNSDCSPRIDTDGVLPISQLNITTLKLIQSAGPWGQQFPEPTFHDDFIIREQKLVGDKHLKMILSPVDHYGFTIDAIQFNADLSSWPNQRCRTVTVVYQLGLNDFRGNAKLQLIVNHIQPADKDKDNRQVCSAIESIDFEDI